MGELKDCPFCQRKDTFANAWMGSLSPVAQGCCACGARGPLVVAQTLADAKTAAIEAWNGRALPSEQGPPKETP